MADAMTDQELHLKKFQKELSAGSVSLVLLAVLAGAGEPMYGYRIAKRLSEGGDGVLAGKQSALYPVLRNLSAAGLLESEVEPSVAGPPRREVRHHVEVAGGQAGEPEEEEALGQVDQAGLGDEEIGRAHV